MKKTTVGSLVLVALLAGSGTATRALEVEVETDGPAVVRAPSVVRPPCPGRFTVVLHEFQNGIHQPQFRIIDNVVDWCTFWDDVHSDSSSPPPCDTNAIDFSREVAVVAAVGDRSNTCYDERVTCVERRGDSIHIVAVETRPGFSCGCGDAMTQPLDVVKVSRPASEATFTWNTATLNCPH